MKNIRRITAMLLCMLFAICGMCYTGAAPAAEFTDEGSFITHSAAQGGTSKPATVTFIERNGVRITAAVSENAQVGSYSVSVAPGVYDIVIE